MTTAQSWRQRLTHLRLRLAALLSVAVLPLGIVAVVQTASVVNEAQRLERNDIAARTLRAANVERALLRRAYGAAEVLGAAAVTLGTSSAACETIMRRYADADSSVIFAGFIDIDGIMRCSSNGERIDFNGFADWIRFRDDPRPLISYNASGAASGQPVLIASTPIYSLETGALEGAASVSLPGQLLDMTLQPEFENMKLALLDAQGTVLAGSVATERFEHFGIIPNAFDIPQTGLSQTVLNQQGEERLAILIPLISGRVYVLGVWDGALQSHSVPVLGTTAPLFPILMWLIALGVGIFAIDRLVLRHLTVLRRRMAGFSFDVPDNSHATLHDAPREIADIANTYNRMVDRLLADRAELAQALDEKEILLREVHHRVKNNLQMIASMISIQMRKVPQGPTRQILRRMQDRVMSLSSIHKALYSGNTLSRVRADTLLQDVVQAGLFIGLPAGANIDTHVDLAPVDLDPDQAVPLALLASELATNAVKYVGRQPDGTAYLHISLSVAGEDVTLRVENSIGQAIQTLDASDGTGLGANLIEAFVGQLDATLTLDAADSHYRVTVQCPGLAADPSGARTPDHPTETETNTG